uniref:Uncharacterized protein n=1 Tax=Craspedostauros australis TaxID=1486917 RepID=A0A7S0F5N5_9STRA|mmetsp:Transcript_7277/g.19693  ORF Transcript_7277/g.19693 Transcript_7277/m.19693 type:complete len:119 (+) Transcript_7277:488-844(+)|eukprot:CAMPEP_0198127676 /NCGR_PEP_ID=MMETSP1442-20131203/47716_1 /TAXON_ID= /ORGANISM="Craspedostauros australis, Strain CCMP3328" /LENGTH=118 /DNA_ID=CAMNT_0043787701 /DNA_START=413 /DNA_END=769 /DNA_ORIENTATION=-
MIVVGLVVAVVVGYRRRRMRRAANGEEPCRSTNGYVAMKMDCDEYIPAQTQVQRVEIYAEDCVTPSSSAILSSSSLDTIDDDEDDTPAKNIAADLPDEPSFADDSITTTSEDLVLGCD